jgi:hypothetical protein
MQFSLLPAMMMASAKVREHRLASAHGTGRKQENIVERKTLMAIPLLIILGALLLWTLIPTPDLEKQPVDKRQR